MLRRGFGFHFGPGQGPKGPKALGPWGWMLVFGVRIEVVGSVWWLVWDIGLGFGPAPRAGPEGPWPQGRRPWGWILVFCVRIEVVGSLRWQESGLGLG